MNTPCLNTDDPVQRRSSGLFCRLTAIGVALAMLSPQLYSQQRSSGIRGVVTDASGTSYIEGASVRMAGSENETVTDRRGEFTFRNLAPGDYDLEVTYAGMEPQVVRTTVRPGEMAPTTIRLAEDVVTMGGYSVVADRSADSIALAQQRNAPNIKNVVDIATYGRLNNDNPAELLQLLPGVFGSFFAGEVDRVTIRGIEDSLNNVQLDGNAMATPAINGAATDRSSVLSTTNSNNIKTAEVIKALTPDRSADAIGGIVNLIQRTGLDYPESAGRFNYVLGGQYVTTDSGWDTRVTPSAQLTYHDALGAGRRWGIYVTGGFNKETTNQFNTNQNIVNNAKFGPIPGLFTSTENDRFRYRKNWAATLNFRPSPDHEFILKYKHDEWFEDTEFLVTQFNSTSPTAAWTHDVRTYNSSTFAVQHPHNPAEVKTDTGSFEGHHQWGDWEAEYSVFASRSIARVTADTNDNWGTAVASLPNTVKFTYSIDSTENFTFPKVNFLTGDVSAIYNPDNYTLGQYQKANFYTDDQRKGARFDLKRSFDLRHPVSVKIGAARDVQSRLRRQRNNRYAFVGEDGVLGVNSKTGMSDDRLSRFLDPNPAISGPDEAGNRRPFMLNLRQIAESLRNEPQLWNEDVYTNTVNSLVNNFQAIERIDAGFAMAESQFGKLRILGGVRIERTEVEAVGAFSNPVQATAAQIPDPVERAYNNAGDTQRRTRSYENSFPSLHASYALLPDLLLRASYSTGIGRPAYGAIVPDTTINDNARRITTTNTGLKPQYADSYDLSAEYFLKPAGIVSVGLFRKDIKDYLLNTIGIVEPGSEFGDQYVGYELHTTSNAGSAKVQGVEFNYIQQLNFIPRSIGLVTLKGNLTVLKAEGDFGGATNISSSEIPGFVPRAWNVIGEFTRGRFYALCRYNRQEPFLVAAVANPALKNTSAAREKIDLNLVYRWRSECEFFLSVDNLTNQYTAFRIVGEGDAQYAGQVYAPQRRFSFGVQGKF